MKKKKKYPLYVQELHKNVKWILKFKIRIRRIINYCTTLVLRVTFSQMAKTIIFYLQVLKLYDCQVIQHIEKPSHCSYFLEVSASID